MIGWFAWAAVGCSEDTAPLTQIMVVVDSDLAGVDAVRVQVEGLGKPKHSIAKDLQKLPLPRTLAVVHQGGPLGPIEVIAEAMAGEDLLVSRRAELSFIQGRNLMLSLDLDESCLGSECDESDQTCIDGSCEPIHVNSGKLPNWSGLPDGGHDAGADGGMPDMPDAEADAGHAPPDAEVEDASSGPDAGNEPSDCDSCKFDEGIDDPHGTLSCKDDDCSLSCDSDYIDLDQHRGNGCEERAGAFLWTPSNVDPQSDALEPAISETLTLDCTATLDFGSAELPATVDLCGQTITPVQMAQDGGSDVVVLATRQLTMTPSSVVRFTGARPVVLLVYGDASVEGELDVSAQGKAGGAGSGVSCETGTGAAGTTMGKGSSAGGGGGGGFGTAGGAGGTANLTVAGGAGGMPSADTKLSPLRGGCAGGAGGKSQDAGSMGPGGAGGGALQLSVSGLLRISGAVVAAGGGGRLGSSWGDGGGGGGSGGGLLLEATRIELIAGAWLTANGGSGSGGWPWCPPVNVNAGADGARRSDVAAQGGTGKGPGAAGAAGNSPAQSAPATLQDSNGSCLVGTNGAGGGGGGGGVGIIALRADECQLDGGTSPPTSCNIR